MSGLYGFNVNSKSRSTKTRIETILTKTNMEYTKYSKSRSTKTRIETIKNTEEKYVQIIIRNQDPLKQGLKQITFPLTTPKS